MDIRVEHRPQSGTFEAFVDDRSAGHLYYREQGPDVWLMYSTVVQPDMEGHGIGSALVHEAVAAARHGGKQVESTCWFVTGWLERHPEALS